MVVEFDMTEQEEKLAQSASELSQAEQEIAKMRADIVVQRAEQQVTLLMARFDVRRAELDAKRTSSSAPSTQEEPADARGIQGSARAAGRRSHLSRRHGPGVAGGARREAEQGAAAMETAQRNIERCASCAVRGLVVVKENDANGAAS